MIKRIQVVFIIVIGIFAVLVYRLFNLQIFENENMLKKVSAQRMISVSVNRIRGTIFDRNLIPLTDNNEKIILSVIPQLIQDKEYVSRVIAQYCGQEKTDVQSKINKNIPFEYIINLGIQEVLKDKLVNGMIITKTNSRYGENSIAKHLIGYLNSDNEGKYGIEKSFNEYLSTSESQNVGVMSDAIRRPLMGYGYRAVNMFKNNSIKSVKLTIDSHLQRIIEDEFEKYSYSGAAVLLDVKSGDCLAMVSMPDYNQDNVSQYFESQNKELTNKALCPYSLGSIFKIVVANAALESGVIDKNSKFYCPGYIEVDGQLKRCSSFYAGGHGEIDLKDAFAKSCNTAFIEIGLKLGYVDIIKSANKFGFGQNLGLSKIGLYENPGVANQKKYFSRREIANISIGQGEIMATPIQVANMINIIANDGMSPNVNIVESIIDEDGYEIEKIRDDSKKQIASKENVQIIKEMMREAVDSGTGKSANMYEYGGVSGKTSSAETGQYSDDIQVIQAWFGGFFPNENPKYSLVILIEDGKSGSATAAPLFGEISKKIMKMNK